MKNCLFAMAIFAVSLNSHAQAFNYEMFGTDSVEFYMKLDSAIKATPDFGYALEDTALLVMQIFMPETLAKLTEIFEDFENYDSYEHISAHLEGGWEIAANTEDEYFLIKPHRGDKFWIKKLAKGINNEYYKSSLMLFKIDCTEGMWGIVQATEYDAKGVVINSIPAVEEFLVNMSYATPDTVGEAFVESACK